MQAVRWDYCGDDATGTKVLRSFGTKFAADNWMHKAMGIQLGLTDSLRCQLPEGTDGTGYWRLTVYALGYADYSFVVQATDANIVKPAEESGRHNSYLQKRYETAKANLRKTIIQKNPGQQCRQGFRRQRSFLQEKTQHRQKLTST